MGKLPGPSAASAPSLDTGAATLVASTSPTAPVYLLCEGAGVTIGDAAGVEKVVAAALPTVGTLAVNSLTP